MHTIHNWLSAQFKNKAFTVTPLTGDASFRRYFRITVDDKNFILMDAPPEKENVCPFIAIAKSLEKTGVQTPHIFSEDATLGFLLLSDFGDTQLLSVLNSDSVDTLYRSSIDVLLTMQRCEAVSGYDLPLFDDALFWREFEILESWYIKKHLNKKLLFSDEEKLKKTYQLLIDSAQAQPQCFVHRDYHSRNIMLCKNNSLGILDFQDAVRGPITYDLVSLLRDCYIVWASEKIEVWVCYFYKKLKKQNQLLNISFETFMRWFDWMGLQRHLKCLGIFSRLHYRDYKNNYLKEIPRVLDYVICVCKKYPEFDMLLSLLKARERIV